MSACLYAYVCLPVFAHTCPCRACVWMHFYGMVGMRVWHGRCVWGCAATHLNLLTCVTPLRGYLTPLHQDEYRTSVRCAKCKQPVTAVSAREKLCTSEQCKNLVFNRLGPTPDTMSPPRMCALPTPTSRGRCTCGMVGVCVPASTPSTGCSLFLPPPLSPPTPTHTHTPPTVHACGNWGTHRCISDTGIRPPTQG